MTADLQTLFEAVVKNPDLDEPRLAFAAACEVHDPERAEFIRLQIAEAVASREGRRDEAAQLFGQLFNLPTNYADRWAGPIRDHVKRFRFHRGFVEYVAVDAQAFLDRADELYAMAPIRRLKLTRVTPVVEEVCRSAHLAQIVSLAIDNEPIGDRVAELLAESPHVRKLGHLWLVGCDLSARGVEALASSSNLPSLRSVDGLPSEFREIQWVDQGQTINVLPPPAAPAIEQRYGYKRWLHELEETQWRGIDTATL